MAHRVAIRTAPIPDFSVLRVWFGYEQAEQQILTPRQLGLARPTSLPGLAGYQACRTSWCLKEGPQGVS